MTSSFLLSIVIASLSFPSGQMLTNAIVPSLDRNFTSTAWAVQSIIDQLRPSSVIILGGDSAYEEDLGELLPQDEPKTSTWFIKYNLAYRRAFRFDLSSIQLSNLVVILGTTAVFKLTSQGPANIPARARIVFVAADCYDNEYIADTFAQAWSLHLLNLLLLVECNGQIDAFAYFLYANNECANDFKRENIVKLGYWPAATMNRSQFVEQTERHEAHFFHSYHNVAPYFPSKVPLLLPAVCSMRVIAHEWPPFVIDPHNKVDRGFEIDFLKIVEHVSRSNIEWLQSTPLYSDAIPGLQNRSVNLMLGSLYAYAELAEFDQSYMYYRNGLIWTVPRAKPMDSSKMLYMLITEQYLLFTIIFSLVPVIAIIVRLALGVQMGWPKRMRFGVMEISAFMFRALVDTTNVRLPRSAWLLKFAFSVWNLGSVIIIGSFTTTLTSTLALPDYEDQVSGMHDIAASDLRITTSDLFSELIESMPHGKEIWKRNENTPLPNGLRIVALGESACFGDFLRSRFISLQWQNQDGSSSLYFLNDVDRSSYLMGLVMNRGHPLFERVDDLVHRVGDMGFWSCHVNRYFDRMLIRTMVRRMRVIYNHRNGLDNTRAMALVNELLRDDEWPVVTKKNTMQMTETGFLAKFDEPVDQHLLCTEHLMSAYILLCGGHGMAAIVLIAEVCWARHKRNGLKVLAFNPN